MTTITYDKAIEIIRKIILEEGGQQYKAAARLKITAGYLSDILAGNRKISDNLARRLGYRRVIFFEKILKSEIE